MSKTKERKKDINQKGGRDFDSILGFLFDETRFASMEKIRIHQIMEEKRPKKRWFFAQ